MWNYEYSLLTAQRDLYKAVKHRTVAEIKVSLNKYPNFKDDTRFSYMLLLMSLDRWHKSTSLLLIKNNCTVSYSLKTNRYKTPLYYALEKDDMTIFGELYKRGASIYDTDVNSETPLELIMQHQNSKFWNVVLQKIDFDSLNPNCQQHNALFHAACYRGDLQIAKKFIEKKFSVNSRSDFRTEEWSGATPLQFALKGARPNKNEIVKYLLQFDVDFDVQDDQGNTLVLTALQISKDPSNLERSPLISRLIRNRSISNKYLDVIYKEYIGRSKEFHNRVNRYRLSHFHLLCSLDWDGDGLKNYTQKILDILKIFISNGVNVNSANHLNSDGGKVDCAGFTALHWAAKKSSLEVVRLLLENGADPTKIDEKGRTPLHLLDLKNPSSFKMVHLLLEYGAEVDVIDFDNQTPLHCAFYTHKRNEPMMQLLWFKSKGKLDLTDYCGLSYLHIASTRDFERVKVLVENGASVNSCIYSDSKTLYGYTPLHLAVSFNKLEIVEYLLSQGAKINFVTSIKRKTTPLIHLACTEQLKYFYGAGDENNDYFQEFNATFQGNPPILDTNDWILSRNKQMRIIELLAKNGASVNDKDSQDLTPLAATCHLPERTACTTPNYIIERKDGILEEITIRRTMIVQKLVSYGANVNSRERYGKPVFHTLFDQSSESVLEKNVAETLLKEGANVDIADSEGLTLLHYVVENLTKDVAFMYLRRDSLFVDLFLSFGANVNSKSKKGDSILHTSVKYHRSGVECREDLFVKLLEQSGVDLGVKNSIGDTPLHSAVKECQPFCVKSLLAAGANVNIENAQGHTPVTILQKILEDRNYELRKNEYSVYEIIVAHLKKLIKLDRPVSRKNKNCLDALHESSDLAIDVEIENEMKKLRSMKINQYTSLFKILVGNPEDITNYVKNKDLMELMSSDGQLESDFPLFYSFLKDQWQKILSRSLVVEPAKRAFRVVTNVDWTESCCEGILRHLRNDDLKTLSLSVSVNQELE